ncbi:hypothetical protein ACWOFR_15895 [Carnobacterium gallinarum]|uniref:hypothetical protein n=1 Tax=Carnobacterium gallinarum TaxID=2749 RepID=UPI000689359D|nr:hypothetical protein [Carnobacterium gallinarum]
MNTCKYCGSELDPSNFCTFCQIQFTSEDVQHDGKRQSNLIEEIPFETNEILKMTTQQLLKEKTLYLVYALRVARRARNEQYQHKVNTPTEAFIKAKKLCTVIESILFERMGSIPKRVDNKYIRTMIEDLVASESSTRMIMN